MYSFQTFSIGQIFTAGQANQIEANARDHSHGVAGVSNISTFAFTSAQLATALSDETGTGLAVFNTAPVFATQITTPKIVTASGNLVITPVGNVEIKDKNTILTNANVAHGITDYVPTDAYCVLQPNHATNGGVNIFGATDGDAFALKLIGLSGEASPTKACIELGVGKKFGTSAQALAATEKVLTIDNWGTTLVTLLGNGNVGIGTLTPAALFSVGSTSQFAVGATGIVTAGTVPLARMMRTEVQGSAAAVLVDLGPITVVANDRILLTAAVDIILTGSTTTRLHCAETGAGNAVVDFAGNIELYSTPQTSATIIDSLSGVCRVTTGGTLTLRVQLTAGTRSSGTIYAHAIVLNNG